MPRSGIAGSYGNLEGPPYYSPCKLAAPVYIPTNSVAELPWK